MQQQQNKQVEATQNVNNSSGVGKRGSRSFSGNRKGGAEVCGPAGENINDWIAGVADHQSHNNIALDSSGGGGISN